MSALPALFGPGRRAAWHRFVLRRLAAGVLVLAGYVLAAAADPAALLAR